MHTHHSLTHLTKLLVLISDGPNFSQPLPLPSSTMLEEMAGIEIRSFTLAPPRSIAGGAKFARVAVSVNALNKSKVKRKFACKICNKRFYHKTACQTHILTHIGKQSGLFANRFLMQVVKSYISVRV